MTIEQFEEIKNTFDKYYYEQKKKIHSGSFLKRLKKAKNKLEWTINLIRTKNESNFTISKLLKQNCTRLDYWKKERRFYRFKRKLQNLINSSYLKIESLLDKSKAKTKVTYKYSSTQCKRIRDNFFSPTNWHNITSLWLTFRLKKGFETISINTFRKIIHADERYPKLIKMQKIKHSRRKYDIAPGNLQMDIKVIPVSDTNISQPVYEIDFIDEQTKLVYSKIIQHQNLTEIMNHTKGAISFFKYHKIKVKRIRTDNYMAFKKTNFVKNGHFDRYLRSQGIIHEFIPLGEPQCNGTTERFHRIIDDEFLKSVSKVSQVTFFTKLYDKWINFYNNKRWHYYQSIKAKTFAGKFEIPKLMAKRSISQFQNLD